MKRVLYSLLPSFCIRKVAARGPYRHLKIGLIADELSSACLARECRTRAVTPLNYKMLFKSWRPDLLFVESAWHGPGNVWKFKIAAYPDHPERNNHVLRRVVSYAQDLGIPCVFWNKEDGVHFERFIGSASLFDTIFTVDENCIPRYRAVVPHGTRVHSLMFAVQPAVHSMAGVGPRFSKACFVGSYSHHVHDKRRYWQDMMFRAASRAIAPI